MGIDLKRIDPLVVQQYRQQAQSNLEFMRSYRLSFWAHWAQCAEVYLPRRYKWFVTPNQYNKGAAINGNIIDETGVLAARTLASGMMGGLTSPTKPWFKLGLHDLAKVDYGPVKDWLAECERRILRVLSESNFYQSLGVMYHDNGVFGSAGMIIYEDDDDVIRCYNPCLGEFFFGASDRLDIDTLAREFTLTVSQAVQMFGIENVGESVAGAYRSNNKLMEVVIQHVIEPNVAVYAGGSATELPFIVPKKFAYRECYWCQTTDGNTLLKAAGFNEKPFVGARWDTVSNDPYGRSPGMDALPATRQLQIEQRRKGEAIDKMVRPPMNASVNMKNEPMSILPGAINYVADLNSSGFAPAYKVEPRLQEMMMDIKEVQARVNSVFFVDLFMMISQLDTVRTATEIDARREEKLIQLGPVIERFENEVLDPIIDRVFAIMVRRKLFPPPPPEIQGEPLNVSYISMLAEAQRAASTAAIERLLQLAGGLMAVAPTTMDNIDIDKLIDEYADLLNVSPTIIRASKAVAAIRAQRDAAQQQQAQMQNSLAAAQGAQTLSKTDVGGGQNALQKVMGG